MHGRIRLRIRSTAVVAVALATLTACAPGTALVPSPSITPPVAPTASAAALAPSPSAPPASLRPAASADDPDPIPEGSYTTGPITAEMMVAAVKAHGLKASDAESFIKNDGFKVHEVVVLTLADGTLTLFQSLDGGTPTVGWRGSYAFADEATMVASDGYPITYGFMWDGDLLRLKVVKDSHPDPFDLVAQVALYESAPLKRVP